MGSPWGKGTSAWGGGGGELLLGGGTFAWGGGGGESQVSNPPLYETLAGDPGSRGGALK